MLSFWERESFTHYDFIIAGSGITGLSTAASIKEHLPDANILIIEKGMLPTGASTRNAGFACFGSAAELLADMNQLESEKLLDIVKMRWEGLSRLRFRLGDTAIDYQNNGGYELIFNGEEHIPASISKLNDWLMPLFNKDVFHIDNSLISKFGFNKDNIHSLIVNPFEGQINTGKMMNALLNYVSSRGVKIINGSTITNFVEDEHEVKITVAANNKEFQFTTEKFAICTNAFTKNLIPNIVLNPGRGQVLVTKPIPNLPFKGIFHFDDGYYYFRNFENRVIFGGGRNLDFETETTTEFGDNENIQKKLIQYLHELILPNVPFEIDMLWSGIMAFGPDKSPIVQKISERIAVGVRLNGIGIAIGSMIGEQLSQLLLFDS